MREWSPRNLPRQPVSRAWGYDRGTPVDRYYIEKFLEQHSIDVQGCVLEIGDNFYTLRYGGTRVEKSEVLNDTEVTRWPPSSQTSTRPTISLPASSTASS